MHLSEKKNDQETDIQASNGHQRQTDDLGNAHGQHHIVHLGTGYGVCFSARIMGKRGGQSRNIQDDFTRFFYTYRRHDWVPEWYQTHAK